MGDASMIMAHCIGDILIKIVSSVPTHEICWPSW